MTCSISASFRSCLCLAASRKSLSSCSHARSHSVEDLQLSFRLSSVSIQISSSRMYSIARRDRCDRRRCALLAASSCDCPSQRTGDGGRRDPVSAEARVRKRPCWCASISGKGLEYRMGRSRALFGSKWRFDPLHPSECCDNLGDRSYRAMRRVSVMSDRSLSLSADLARNASRRLHRGHGGKRWRPGCGRVRLSQGVF